MIAQIRTGLWVRNGFAIRGQLLHYRDFMLRELCYDQDIFILQSALTLVDDPDIILVSVIDRFQLLEWFTGSFASKVYEGSHLFSMVEEVLYMNSHEEATPAQIHRRTWPRTVTFESEY